MTLCTKCYMRPGEVRKPFMKALKATHYREDDPIPVMIDEDGWMSSIPLEIEYEWLCWNCR